MTITIPTFHYLTTKKNGFHLLESELIPKNKYEQIKKQNALARLYFRYYHTQRNERYIYDRASEAR